MSFLRIAALASGALSVAFVACQSFSVDDGSGGSGADAGSARDGEAPPDGDVIGKPPLDGDAGAADAADAALANLLSNGDFELGCAGWVTPGDGTLTETELPELVHGGKKACVVCVGDPTGVIARVGLAVAPPAEFLADVWFRTVPDSAPPTVASLAINVEQTDYVNLQIGPGTSAPAFNDVWQRVSALIDVDPAKVVDGGTLEVILSTRDKQRCFVIDDARLYRVK
jgi:hypothetical protein